MKGKISLLAFMILAALISWAKCESPGDDFISVAENARFRLFVNAEKGTLALEDKDLGRLWYSNPPDGSKDKNSKGIPKTNMQSLFIFNMYDDDGLTSTASTLVASVNKDGFTYEPIENGVRLRFDCPRASEDFVFAADVTIEDDCMRVELRYDLLKERTNIYLYSVAVLPYFGAGGLDDDGCLIIPDGCGAVMRFNNGRAVFGDWDKRVYGTSLTMSKQFLGEIDETVRLPFYGIINNDGAMLVELSQGAGRLTATQSLRLTSYTTGYFTADTRFFDSASLTGANDTVRNVTLTIGDALPKENPVTRYYPVSEPAAPALASKYRDVLTRRGVLSNANDTVSRLYLTLTGAATVNKAVVGVPIDTVVPLTTFDQARKILAELSAGGVDQIALKYDGWLTGGLGGPAPFAADAERALGDIDALAEYARREAIPIYLNADFVNISGKHSGMRSWDMAKGINKSAAYRYAYKLSTLFPDTMVTPGYVVAYDRLLPLVEGYADSLKRLPYAGVSADSLGNCVFYDWHDGGFVFFEEVRAQIIAGLNTLGADKPLLLSNPNVYALPFADALVDVPLYSSRHKLFDYEMPIVQMVLHGAIDYASTPINRADDVETALLRAIECGSALQFSLIYENPSSVKYTIYSDLYANYYIGWTSRAAEMYARAKPVLDACAGARIIGYERFGALTRVAYDNGVAVLVNYGKTAAVYDNVTVAARDFAVLEAER